MSFFDRFLIRTIQRKDGFVVFRRWKVLSNRHFSVFVHAMYDHDRDMHCHDHPWSFASLILKGGYEETVQRPLFQTQPDGHWVSDISTRVRRPGSFGAMPAEGVYHRITRLLDGPNWSLVLASGRRRDWGYMHDFLGWVHNKTYRAMKNHGLLSIPGGKHDAV